MKTELTRRTFLRGMMALAGAAALGAPTIVETKSIVEPARNAITLSYPEGDLGSIRIGKQWYPLDKLNCAVDYDYIDVRVDSGRMFKGLSKIDIALDMSVGGDLSKLSRGQTHDIEIVAYDAELGKNVFAARVLVRHIDVPRIELGVLGDFTVTRYGT